MSFKLKNDYPHLLKISQIIVGPKVPQCYFIYVLFVIIIFGVGCDRRDDWTDSDRGPITAFVRSLEVINEAHELSNQMGAGIRSDKDITQKMHLYEQAYAFSQQTIPKVLEKANPELSSIYYRYFQEGLRLRIQSWKDADSNAEIKGSSLLDSWGDWYSRATLKIPKRMVLPTNGS